MYGLGRESCVKTVCGDVGASLGSLLQGSSGVALFPDGFMPFLPRDNGGFDEPESEKAVEAINEDWGWLLRLPPADFWAVVQSEESLSKCLDSYLRFKRYIAHIQYVQDLLLVHGFYLCRIILGVQVMMPCCSRNLIMFKYIS